MHRGFCHRVFRRNPKGGLLDHLHDTSLVEIRLRRATAYVACLVTLALTGIAIVLNIVRHNPVMVMPLCRVEVGVGIAVLWLWMDNTAEFGPLYICLGILALLAGFMLVHPGKHYDVHLFYWFLLFPPMIMFCLGLRQGTVFFCVFLFFLILMLVTPLQVFLAEPLSRGIRIRFLVTLIGTFVFSWGAEYTRFQAQKTLSRTLARLELDSLTDHLTGLANRRNFYNFYSIFFLGASARKYPFTLVIADIDHFKAVNDTFGHEVGDRVLCHVADIFRAGCREADKLYRWGGEEFLLLMPHTTAGEARLALERMRETLSKTPYHTEDGRILSLTASFGLYEGSAENDLEQQISLADQNLYAAKREGRNRVVG
ncbi:GGDEF domain-containing protein [Desulfosarcina sp. OttesenSCG-928-B08]|nr:GGDEF domain-containing protein [Desulfosarcina sp. OttesenSCG-928-B08]